MKRPVDGEVEAILAWLKRQGSKRNRQGMARYAIRSEKIFGVSVATLRRKAKLLGRDHELAAALWSTGWYEARMPASLVDEPALVTPARMDRRSRDFDNWAICDTVCFHLFDRAPHAWRKLAVWSRRRDEFVKRAAFALLASLAAHDKRTPDAAFLKSLPLVERAAGNERNFVKKAVSRAMRAIGNRSYALHAETIAFAGRLPVSPDVSRRWIGRDAIKDLSSAATARRLAARSRAAEK